MKAGRAGSSRSARRISLTSPPMLVSDTVTPGQIRLAISPFCTTAGRRSSSNSSRSNALGERCSTCEPSASWRVCESTVKGPNVDSHAGPRGNLTVFSRRVDGFRFIVAMERIATNDGAPEGTERAGHLDGGTRGAAAEPVPAPLQHPRARRYTTSISIPKTSGPSKASYRGSWRSCIRRSLARWSA